jgi:lipoprotein NlpD
VVVEPAKDSLYAPGREVSVPARTPIPGGSYVVVKGDTLYSIAFRKGVDFRDLAQWNGIAAPYTIWPGQRLTLSPAATVAMAHASGVPAHPPRVATKPEREASVPVFASVTPTASSSATTVKLPPKPARPAVAAATTLVPVAGMQATGTSTAPPPVPVVGGASRAVSGVSWRWPADGSLISRFNGSDAIPGIEIAGRTGDPVRAAADGVVVYSGNGLVGYGELVIIKHNDSFLSAYGHNRKRWVKEGQRVSAGQQIAEMGSTGAPRNELEFQIRKDGNPVDPLSYLPSR